MPEIAWRQFRFSMKGPSFEMDQCWIVLLEARTKEFIAVALQYA